MSARGSAHLTEKLVARLASEGLDAHAWGNGPGERYPDHAHGHDKVLVVVAGSIVFSLPDADRSVALSEGDRLELSSDTVHGARVGPDGVQCLEAHLPRGSLRGDPIHRVAWVETTDERVA